MCLPNAPDGFQPPVIGTFAFKELDIALAVAYDMSYAKEIEDADFNSNRSEKTFI